MHVDNQIVRGNRRKETCGVKFDHFTPNPPGSGIDHVPAQPSIDVGEFHFPCTGRSGPGDESLRIDPPLRIGEKHRPSGRNLPVERQRPAGRMMELEFEASDPEEFSVDAVPQPEGLRETLPQAPLVPGLINPHRSADPAERSCRVMRRNAEFGITAFDQRHGAERNQQCRHSGGFPEQRRRFRQIPGVEDAAFKIGSAKEPVAVRAERRRTHCRCVHFYCQAVKFIKFRIRQSETVAVTAEEFRREKFRHRLQCGVIRPARTDSFDFFRRKLQIATEFLKFHDFVSCFFKPPLE